IETIRWGGKPEKTFIVGPLGPRLTPRGSFEVWQEEVRGTSVPWSLPQRELAQHLLADLSRANSAQLAEIGRARTQLLAMLGHDLRDPLQSISMAAKVLERSEGEGARTASGARLGQRIQSSSSRMARLIGQVLDASRLQTGMGLQLQATDVDLSVLLEDLLDEARVAHPGLTLVTELPPSLPAVADPDRVAQLFANLISNARHHGAPGEAVIVQLSQQGEEVSFEVSNSAPPIPQDLVPHLFNAFKRQTQPSSRNRSGLGLGLHIARAIASSHGGTLDYAYAEPYVVFSARFPVRRPEAR
ncbi:MAG: histidine kinase, partial [Comamonadaceae bacterium]